MLTTIKGTYDNGQITLDETPLIQERMEVIITFLGKKTAESEQIRKGVRLGSQGVQFGLLTGKVAIPADFNEPLDDLNEYM